jgi:hypothetical protein
MQMVGESAPRDSILGEIRKPSALEGPFMWSTLRQVRAVDKDSKLAAEDIRHFQELTTSVLVPQLNHERTFFYDPSSRQLLPQYAWYPTAFQDMVDYCNKIRPEIDELRKRIAEERKRNR